ncbi:TonB-dependent receptor [Halomonas aestuarii]|uniref:TonB-dependent receptor n=1 Tax=Halomonas aestuarii TaxID=1897729 RepID=A0A1J0VD78_9GAMM|nr:TonB-dependent receptor [Halomonas aestuarii]APE29984.1 TonB-dependent receptor [Halomonas aestuarii]
MPYRFTLLLLACWSTLSWGQTSEDPDRQEDTRVPSASEALPTITVTAPRLARDLYDTPAAVTALTREDIQQGQQGVRLDEALVTVPGVFLQNRDNFAQGQRIAIRGFGARAPFGIRGIHVRVDGFPYTLPDGQAQVDAVDLDSAERIEVIRGPSSVLYGNAAGGVVDIQTGDGSELVRSPVVTLQGGSHDFRKLAIRNGGEYDRWIHSISVSALDFDGYREQSKVKKRLLNGRLGYRLDDDRTLSALVNVLDNPRAEDPSALTAEEVAEDPSQARDFAIDLDSRQEVEQQLIGLHYEDLAMGEGEFNARAFVSRRDFLQQLPFPGSSLIDYERHYYGGSLDYTLPMTLANRPLRTVVGLDVARQEDDRGRRSVDGTGEVTGVTANEQQNATSAGVFLQSELGLTERLDLSAGVRHDSVRMTIDDRLVDADDPDQSGSRTFREWTGSLGMSYRFHPDHQLYATLGTAFETPTFTEFAPSDGSGGFNPDIEPQTSLNREVGLRGRLGSGLTYDLAAFSVLVDDELIQFQASDGRDYYRNAGKTRREGIELGLDWNLSLDWRLSSALTLADYEFERFRDEDGSYDGNDLPGLPSRLWMNRLTWYGSGERFATLEAQYNGSFYADNANEVQIPSHWLFNLRAGDAWRLGGGNTRLGLNVGVRNLLDEDYYENVRINAFGGRYYEPAPGTTWFAGLELGF